VSRAGTLPSIANKGNEESIKKLVDRASDGPVKHNIKVEWELDGKTAIKELNPRPKKK
jgi:hypothetical protein